MNCQQFIVLFSSFFFLASHTLELHAKNRSRQLRADYVIVGAGTAGATLAKKLTDDNSTSVIALHSGQNLTSTPDIKFSPSALTGVLSTLIGPPLYEKGKGSTIAKSHTDVRQLLWTLALPEGGVNAGAWCRGTNQVYTEWEALNGAEWSQERILQAYKMLENYQGKTTNPAARGFKGPLEICQESHPSDVALTMTKAMVKATGFPFVIDYNDPNEPIGISSQFQYTQSGKKGEFGTGLPKTLLNEKVMTSSGKGLNGRKLRVLFNSLGLKTIWQGNKAVGVEFSSRGKMKKVFANKGVIVCAGITSSSFLLHSGIGPKQLLESLGIPVTFDNPNVGQELTTQPRIVLVFSSNPTDVAAHPHGHFSQIAWLPAPGGDQKKREILISTANPIAGITIALLELCQPRSRGNISIDSINPLKPPVVQLNMLGDAADFSLFKQSLQIYVKAINKALQRIDPTYSLIYPNPAILDDETLLTTFIKESVGSNMHYQSHCRMAPLQQHGVVDSTGHVYGVKNLIVADDSVVPQATDGSPMAAAYLVAANIARLLVNE